MLDSKDDPRFIILDWFKQHFLCAPATSATASARSRFLRFVRPAFALRSPCFAPPGAPSGLGPPGAKRLLRPDAAPPGAVGRGTPF